MRTGVLCILIILFVMFSFCLYAWFFYKRLPSYAEVRRICGRALGVTEGAMSVINEQEESKEQGDGLELTVSGRRDDDHEQNDGEAQDDDQENRESGKQGAKSRDRVKTLTKLKVKSPRVHMGPIDRRR